MQLTTESKDPNWAWEMEQKLTQFFTESNTSGEFEILAIECRATLCEILAFGNNPTSPQRWNSITSEMNKQYWWNNFQGIYTATSDQNSRATIVTILQRMKPQGK